MLPPNPRALVDVIFVHGLTGNYVKTWSDESALDAFWPRWLSEDFPTVNVYGLEYDSSIFSSIFTGSGPSLTERAAILFDFLRSRDSAAPKILFVAHSLGGLIVKQLLRRCNDMPGADHKRLLHSTSGICFLGTPHQGASLAASVCNILNLSISKSVKELAYGHTHLVDLSEWFRIWAGSGTMIVESYYETLKTKGVLVVDAVTANPYVSTCSPVAVQSDHIQIAKATSRKTQVYSSVSYTIKKLLEGCEGGGTTGGGSAEPNTRGVLCGPTTVAQGAVPAPPCAEPQDHREDVQHELIEEYQFYTSTASEDRLTLAEKLSLAGRAAEIRRAERKKERFSMALHRSSAQLSSMSRYVHLMSQVETRYSRHVSSLIRQERSADDIDRAVQEAVINPVHSLNAENGTQVTAATIDDCLYYLTGNCHIRWDNE